MSSPAFFTGYLGEIARQDILQENEAAISVLTVNLNLTLNQMRQAVSALAGSPWIGPALKAGSGVDGAGTFNCLAKGPLTNLAGASQAMGYFGAYLKFSGFDGIVFQGRSPDWAYLLIKEGRAEIRDARHLIGKDTFETEAALRKELGVKERDVSIYCVGPAGENGVLYSAICGDNGHLAAKNGLGAVMGAKRLKAVVAYRDKRSFLIKNPERLKKANNALFEHAKGFGTIYKWGTGGGFSTLYAMGVLPVRNYTTNIFPEHERMSGQYLRTHFKIRSKPCYHCRIAHVKEVTVTEGPYTGTVGEEPEYEQIAAWGPVIGNTDLGAVVMLARVRSLPQVVFWIVEAAMQWARSYRARPKKAPSAT